MSEKKGSQIKKADLTVGRRFFRNSERNVVLSIRSIDQRPGLARNGFEVELYHNYGAGQLVRWRTLAEIKAKYTMLI